MKNKTGYLGNQNLKPADEQLEYTTDNVLEYARCMNDPVYFIKNYIKIISLDEGLIPFRLFDYQTRFIESLHNNRRVLGLFPRQMGKCCFFTTLLKIKQKSTGNIVNISIGDFYTWQKFKQLGQPEDLLLLKEVANKKQESTNE